MEFVVMLEPGVEDVAGWARHRVSQGWTGLGVADHLSPSGRTYGHLVATLGWLAAGTERARLCSTYANTLVRSPVEFAQAALTIQQLSGGRFEAGLGAGWAGEELAAMGLDFPEAAVRARRFCEAATIVSEIFSTGSSTFEGEFYQVDVADIGVRVDTSPPLTVAVGGPWTCRMVAPLGDRVELVPFAQPLRAGHMNAAAWREGSPDRLGQLVDWASSANPDAVLSVGCFVAAGTGPGVEQVAAMFGDGPCKGLAGDPAAVADTLRGYSELGIDRCSLVEIVPGTLDLLAEELLSI